METGIELIAGNECPNCGMRMDVKVQAPICGRWQTATVSPSGEVKVAQKELCPYGLDKALPAAVIEPIACEARATKTDY